MLDKIPVYIAIYHGSASAETINGTLRALGGNPEVEMVDLLLDGQCIELQREMRRSSRPCRISETTSQDPEDIGYRISAICNEKLRAALAEGRRECEFYIEGGGLDHVLSGAVYSAAAREGAAVVYLEEDGRSVRKIRFERIGDVSRVGGMQKMALDILHEDGRTGRAALERRLYSAQLAGKSEEEVGEFFKRNHNTYKVIGNLRRKGWVEYQKRSDAFSITEKGNAARVMIDLENEKKKQGKK